MQQTNEKNNPKKLNFLEKFRLNIQAGKKKQLLPGSPQFISPLHFHLCFFKASSKYYCAFLTWVPIIQIWGSFCAGPAASRLHSGVKSSTHSFLFAFFLILQLTTSFRVAHNSRIRSSQGGVIKLHDKLITQISQCSWKFGSQNLQDTKGSEIIFEIECYIGLWLQTELVFEVKYHTKFYFSVNRQPVFKLKVISCSTSLIWIKQISTILQIKVTQFYWMD